MVRLRSVDVLSCAKIYGILHMALSGSWWLCFSYWSAW